MEQKLNKKFKVMVYKRRKIKMEKEVVDCCVVILLVREM